MNRVAVLPFAFICLIVSTAEPRPATEADRVLYAQGLREAFLDQSRSVNVKTSGKDKTTITLTYPLIGDVFIHQFMKSGATNSMRKLGFKNLYLTAGGSRSYLTWHYDLVKDDWAPESRSK